MLILELDLLTQSKETKERGTRQPQCSRKILQQAQISQTHSTKEIEELR